MLQQIKRNQVYELHDTKTGDRYIGQTRQSLTRRRAQHIAAASSGREPTRALHVHLRKVIAEDRHDDIEIREIDAETEYDAITSAGLESLLNQEEGDLKAPPYSGPAWTQAQIKTLRTAATDKMAAQRTGESWNACYDARRKLGVKGIGRGKSRCKLDAKTAREILIDRAVEGTSHRALAEKYSTTKSVVGRLLRGDTYDHVDRPAEDLNGLQKAQAVVYAEQGLTLNDIARTLYATPSAVKQTLNTYIARTTV